MFARDWMVRDVVTVSPRDSILDAQRLLDQHGFRHLPVVEDGQVVGIVASSDLDSRALRVAPCRGPTFGTAEVDPAAVGPPYPFAELRRIPVESCMSHPVVHTSPGASIEEIALLLREHRIGCVPVLDGGDLVGILTETDVFEALIEGFGLRRGGCRVVYDVRDAGEMAAIHSAWEEMARRGRRITSLHTCRARNNGRAIQLVVRSLDGDRPAEGAE